MGGGGSGERRQSVGLVSKVGGGFYCCASFSRASQAGISRLWELNVIFGSLTIGFESFDVVV